MHVARALAPSLLAALPCLAPACRTSAPARGRVPGKISVPWIYHGGRTTDDVPEFAWRADGKLFLWDPQVAEGERTIELYDPASGERRAAVDGAAARASLATLELEAPQDAWDWPESFDDAGRRGLFLLEGDVFVLDLAAARFERLTDTEEDEKAPSFSPDGTRVAYVRANDLWVVDLASREERRLTADGSATLLNGTLSWVYWEEIHGRHDVAYWWSGDSRSLAYLQTDESPVGEAHFVAFEDPYPELLTQRYPKVGSANPLVRVGVVDAAGGETTWVELPPYEYLARVKWLPGDRRLAIQTMPRDQRRLDLFFADARSGSAEPILSESDPAWVNIHDDLWFLADGRHFLWTSERTGFAHLYLYTLEGELVRALTSGEWALASAGGGVPWLQRAVCAVDDAAGWVYFTCQKDGSTERQLYRARLDGERLERVSERAGTHSITFAPDASAYVDRYSNLHTPPALEVHRVGGGTRVVAAPRLAALAPYDLRYPELIEIPARDGFPMPAWILEPADFDPHRRYPLILYVYGGPAAPTVANAWNDSIYFDQVLLDQGYLVARCDNRASTGLSKRTENLVLEHLMGDVEFHDVLDGVRWLEALPYVDAERVGIWGWSGGGSMTLTMLTRCDEFAAGISVAPVSDWRYYDTVWGERTMKRPQDNLAGYDETSMALRAKDLSGRLLLVHGTDDDNVHPQNSWRFADELIEAGIPFDMMIYPMRKHGIADDAARIHLYEKMVEFWRAYL